MKHLTKDEMRKVLAVAKKHSTRNWLMILVAYLHGLRASEVVGEKGLTRRNIDCGEITVKRLKGSLKTTHPLIESDDELFNEKKHLEQMAETITGPFFPMTRQGFWFVFQKYCKEAGLARSVAHPHALKHSIAHHTIPGAGIENLRQYLGHKNISSTGMYLRVDDKTASKAIGAAGGF